MVVEFCESNKSVDGIAVDAGPFVPGSTLDCFTDVSGKMEFLDVRCVACWWVFLCDWVWVESVYNFHVGFADSGYFVESAHSCNSGSVVV